jgi:hypothetical protein
VAAVATAVENGHAAAAAVVGATQHAAAAADASQQEQQQAEDEDAAADPGQEQKQPPQSWVQSYASWATDKASETWQSQSVQVCTACDTRRAVYCQMTHNSFTVKWDYATCAPVPLCTLLSCCRACNLCAVQLEHTDTGRCQTAVAQLSHAMLVYVHT